MAHITTQETMDSYKKVATYANLSSLQGTSEGDVVYVEQTTGTWLSRNKKKSGLWEYISGTWNYRGVEIPQITDAEKSAGTSTEVRRFSPKDVADMGGGTVKELPVGAGPHLLSAGVTYVPRKNYQYEVERYRFHNESGVVKIRGYLQFALHDSTPFFNIEPSSGLYHRANLTLDLSDAHLFNNPRDFKSATFIRKSCGNVIFKNSHISWRSGTFIDNVAYNWSYKPDVIEGCNIALHDSTLDQTFYKQDQRFVCLIIKGNSVVIQGHLVHFSYPSSNLHFRQFDVSQNTIRVWGTKAPIHTDNNTSNIGHDQNALMRFCDNDIELAGQYSLIWSGVNKAILTVCHLNIENNTVQVVYSMTNPSNTAHYADPRSVTYTMDRYLTHGIGVLAYWGGLKFKEGLTGRRYKGKPIYRTEVTGGTMSFGATLTENNINGVTEIIDCRITYTDYAANKYRYTVNNMYISSSQQARIGVDTAGTYSGWLRLWVAGYVFNGAWVEFIR